MSDPLVTASVVLIGVLGLVVGSFLNVVVWRVPRGGSIVRPPSACPGCGAPIRARDNVPVLSWLLLRGRCRDCGEPISGRYPLVEGGTAVLFAAVAWRFLPTLPAATPAFLVLAGAAVALALIDLDHHRLPDVIVLPLYPVTVALLMIASALTAEPHGWSALVRAGIGAAALLGFYGGAWFLYPRGMGLGDVKLAGVLGLALGWLGWGALAVGAFAAFLLGGVFGIALRLAGRNAKGQGIPFGPWMLAGAAVGVAVGEPIWAWYLGIFA